MPRLSDAMPPGPDWLAAELRELRRNVDELRAERSLGAASIEAGDLVLRSGSTLHVKHATGFDLLAVHRDAGGRYVIAIKRDDGSDALVIESTPIGQYLAIKDQHGSIIMSNDASSGVGLARPWLPIPFARVDVSPALNSGLATTQSGSFVAANEAFTHKQHPWATFRGYVSASSDGVTVGEARLVHGETVIGTLTTDPGAALVDFLDWQPSSVQFGQMMQLSYEIRRTAGTGSVYGKVDGWWRQSL